MEASAALTLCTIAETGASLKYICFNTSLKITSGKKAHETHRLVNRRSGNDVFFFRDPVIPARSWPGLRSMSSLIGYEWHHPLGQSSSHPDDVISAEACQWCNAGWAVTRGTPFFISLSLLSIFCSSLFADQNCPDKKEKKKSLFLTCIWGLLEMCRQAQKPLKGFWKAPKKNKEKWQKEHLILLILPVSCSSN